MIIVLTAWLLCLGVCRDSPRSTELPVAQVVEHAPIETWWSQVRVPPKTVPVFLF